MKKTSIKSTVMTMLAIGAFIISTASLAQAQGKRGCSNNSNVGRYESNVGRYERGRENVYYGGQQTDPRYDTRSSARYDSQYDPRSGARYDPRYDVRYDPRYDRNDRYDDEWENQDTAGKAAKRIGIGAAVGAGAGAGVGAVLSDGDGDKASKMTKGAVIGAGVGAATGYIIHRKKVNDQYDRYRRFPF